VNGIWRKFEGVITNKRTGQVIEILLKHIKPGVPVRCALCLVSIPARIVGVSTPAGYGPLHVNRNWLDSFQTAQLCNP
jgi:hypothetical protein